MDQPVSFILHFETKPKITLSSMTVCHSENCRKAERGEEGFAWGAGPQALAIFLLRWAVWLAEKNLDERGTPPRFAGRPHSLAASLNDLVRVKRQWTGRIFGFHKNNLLKQLVHRDNVDFKRDKDGDVVITWDKGVTERLAFEIHINSTECRDRRRWTELADDIERQWGEARPVSKRTRKKDNSKPGQNGQPDTVHHSAGDSENSSALSNLVPPPPAVVGSDRADDEIVFTPGAIIPVATESLFCREDLIEFVVQQVDKPVEIVVIVGGGGLGKSTSLWHLQQRYSQQQWRHAGRLLRSYFEFSFADQGGGDLDLDGRELSADRRATSVPLFAELTEHFRKLNESIAPTLPKTWGEALAKAYLRHGGLVVLDGVETLQRDHSQRRQLEQGLRAFLQYVLQQPKPDSALRLIVVTTRWDIPELEPDIVKERVKTWPLKPLEHDRAVELLREFRLRRKDGTTDKMDTLPLSTRLRSDPRELADLIDQIVRRLYGSPLAIVLFASQLIERQLQLDSAKADELLHQLAAYGGTESEKVARTMVERYDAYFKGLGEQPLFRDCREVLLQLSLFTDAEVRLIEVEALWQEAPIQHLVSTSADYAQALRELARLQLVNADWEGSRTIRIHAFVRSFYRKRLSDDDPAALLAGHSRLFDYYAGRELPDDLSQARSLLAAVRHGVEAGRLKDAFSVLEERLLGERRLAFTIPGAHAELGAAYSRFFHRPRATFVKPHPGQELDNRQKCRVLLRAAGFLTATRGMADTDVGDAYEAAEHVGVQPMERFGAIVGTWRYTLVSGRLNSLEPILVKLNDLQSPDLRESEYMTETRNGIRAVTNFFTGKISGLDQFDAPNFVPMDWRRERLAALNFVYDPLITQYLFAAWAAWLQEKDQRAGEMLDAGLQQAVELNDQANLILAQYFAAAHCQFQNDRAGALERAGELARLTTSLRDLFITHGGSFLSAWARGVPLKGPVPSTTIAEMLQAIEDWEATNAGLMLTYFRTIVGEAYLQNNDLDQAGRLLLAARESQDNGEVWWLPETLRLLAIVYHRSGNTKGALATKAEALDLAEAHGSLRFSRRIRALSF